MNSFPSPFPEVKACICVEDKNAKTLNNRVNAGTFPCATNHLLTSPGLPSAVGVASLCEARHQGRDARRPLHERHLTVTSVPTGISVKSLRAASPGRRMQPCEAG